MGNILLTNTAKLIVKDILYDLTGRKGLGDEWDSIDGDIQDEIKQEWTEMVITRLKKANNV
jgi:hypothetical protein